MIIFLMNLLTWYVPKIAPISFLFIGPSFVIVLTIFYVNDHSGDKTFLCCMTVSLSTQSVSKICTSPTCLFFEQWQRFLFFLIQFICFTHNCERLNCQVSFSCKLVAYNYFIWYLSGSRLSWAGWVQYWQSWRRLENTISCEAIALPSQVKICMPKTFWWSETLARREWSWAKARDSEAI